MEWLAGVEKVVKCRRCGKCKQTVLRQVESSTDQSELEPDGEPNERED